MPPFGGGFFQLIYFDERISSHYDECSKIYHNFTIESWYDKYDDDDHSFFIMPIDLKNINKTPILI